MSSAGGDVQRAGWEQPGLVGFTRRVCFAPEEINNRLIFLLIDFGFYGVPGSQRADVLDDK